MAADESPHPPPARDLRGDPALWFGLFNEIGILAQLSRARLADRLPEGLTASHVGVLNHLTRVRDGRTPLQLARAVQVPKTTMTHTRAGLERRALVETRPSPEDRRSKQVWLTDAGRAFREAAISALAPDIAALCDVLPAEEVARLLPALRRLREAMDAAR